jgi:hypothetical protein
VFALFQKKQTAKNQPKGVWPARLGAGGGLDLHYFMHNNRSIDRLQGAAEQRVVLPQEKDALRCAHPQRGESLNRLPSSQRICFCCAACCVVFTLITQPQHCHGLKHRRK